LITIFPYVDERCKAIQRKTNKDQEGNAGYLPANQRVEGEQ